MYVSLPSSMASCASGPAILRSENRILYFCGNVVDESDNFSLSLATTEGSTSLMPPMCS